MRRLLRAAGILCFVALLLTGGAYGLVLYTPAFPEFRRQVAPAVRETLDSRVPPWALPPPATPERTAGKPGAEAALSRAKSPGKAARQSPAPIGASKPAPSTPRTSPKPGERSPRGRRSPASKPGLTTATAGKTPPGSTPRKTADAVSAPGAGVGPVKAPPAAPPRRVPLRIQLYGYLANAVSPRPGMAPLKGLAVKITAERHHGDGLQRSFEKFSARSDGRGSVPLSLEPGRYTLRILADRYFPWAKGEGAPVTIIAGQLYSWRATLRLRAAVVGRVLLGGRPVSGAHVVVELRNQRPGAKTPKGQETKTDANGRFNIPDVDGNQPHRLVVEASGCLRRAAELEHPLNGALQRTVTMEYAHAIRGVVTQQGDARRKIAGARVSLLKAGQPLTLAELERAVTHTTTSAGGTFIIKDLHAGRYRVCVVQRDSLPAVVLEAGCTLAAGRDLSLNIAMDRGGVIAGMALEEIADGEPLPVESARVEVAFVDDRPGPPLFDLNTRRRLTDAEGKFTISGLPPGRRFRLTVSRDGYSPVTLDNVDPAVAGSKRITLVKNGAIYGMVLAPPGETSLPARYTVSLLSARSGQPVLPAETRRSRILNKREGNKPAETKPPAGESAPTRIGQFEWKERPPGEYLVSVEARGFANVQRRVTLAPGVRSRADLTLDRGSTLGGGIFEKNSRRRVRGALVILDPFLEPGKPPSGGRRATAIHSWVFENVAPGRHSVLVSHPSFADRLVTGIDVPPGGRDVWRDIRLFAGASVRGRVLGRYGRGVPGAHVLITGPGRLLRAADTGADGAYTVDWLPPGDGYRVRVDPRASASKNPLLSRLRPSGRFSLSDGEARAVDFGTRFSNLSIEGTVLTDAGKPMEGAVDVFHMAPMGLLVYTRPVTDGRFRITGLSEGRYLVRVVHTLAEVSLRSKDAEEAAGPVAVKLVVPTGVLRGRVFNMDTGRPIPGATVLHRPAKASARTLLRRVVDWYPRSDTTDEAGRFEIRHVAPGTYSVAAKAPELGLTSTYVALKEGEASVSVHLELGRECGCIVQVRAEDGGRPLADVELLVDGPGGRVNFGRSLRTDARGRVVVRSLAAGTYRILAQAPGRLPVLLRTVTLRDGLRRGPLLLTLPPIPDTRATISVEGPDGAPLPGVEVSIIRRSTGAPLIPEITSDALREGRLPASVTDAGGNVTIRGVEPGAYILEAYHPDYALFRREMTFAPGKRHRIRLVRENKTALQRLAR